MLPGLRFLFAATLMTVSLLIFGMGAIALLRASHQQFASMPPLQPPEPVFAQAPASVPSLSMLRADPAPTALPLAALIQPQREASLTSAERVTEAPAPVVQPIAVEAAPPEPAPVAIAVAPTAESSPASQASPALAEQPAAASVAIAEPVLQPEKPVDLPAEDSPKQTEAVSPPAQIAAISEPAALETTGSITPEAQDVAAKAIADPPLPQARPEVAALSQVAAKAAVTTTQAPRRPAVKRKVRQVKRTAPRSERLPAATSAPPLSLSSFFNGGGS